MLRAGVIQMQVLSRDQVVFAVAMYHPNKRDYRVMQEECVRQGGRREELRTVAGDSELYDHRFNPIGASDDV